MANPVESIKEKSKLIRAISSWQETIWYPAFFALLVAISGSSKDFVYIPLFWVMATLVIFSLIFSRLNRVIFVPMLQIYCAMGRDVVIDVWDISQNNVIGSFTTAGLVNMIVVGVVLVNAIVLRLILSGAFKKAFAKLETEPGRKSSGILKSFTFGLIILSIAALVNGAGSDSWSITNIWIGLLIATGFLFFFFLSYIIIKSDDYDIRSGLKTKFIEADRYIYVNLVFLGVAICIQVTLLLISLGRDAFIYYDNGLVAYVNKSIGALGWGQYILIGMELAVCMMAGLILAHKESSLFKTILCHSATLIFFIFIVITNCRGAIVSCAFIWAAYLFAELFSKKKAGVAFLFILIYLLLISIGILWLVISAGGLEEAGEWLYGFFRFARGKELGGRLELYKMGYNDFKTNPVAGVGFAKGSIPGKNFYSAMYHDIIVELFGGMGLIGLLCFAAHLFDYMRYFAKSVTANKLLSVLIPVLIILLSLTDNTIWYLNMQIFYGALLAASSLCWDEEGSGPLRKRTKAVSGVALAHR